ncbi:MAG: hypothetical protein ACC619_02220 [Paracoccaceae bacterium]
MAKRFDLIIPIAILAVALPGVTSVTYYWLTDDPALRPLDVSITSLATATSRENTRAITVSVLWGEASSSPNSRQQVAKALHRAMRIYDVDYRVRFQPVPGRNIKVRFIVDDQTVGTYPLGNVAAGIPVALAAFRINNDPDG